MALRICDEIRIDRPLEEVWPHVSGLDEELRWRRPYVVDLEVDADPLVPGARVTGTTRAFGQTGTYQNEVTEVSRPVVWLGVAWRLPAA